jgi:crotonobetainyl-CoA:carnitine CoA-transferase CaiB-like acyl-CoA transferase
MSSALSGIRVVDLSRVLAGPMCSQILSDHGADVIKVEPPSGDDTRTLGPPFNENGDAAYFSSLNRGKRTIGIDLGRPRGQEILERLLRNADVVIENFLPGTMEKWGLSYEGWMRERFPRLIYCSVTGFGPDGPLGGLPGYDAVLQAICGLMSVNGDKVSGPTRVGVPVVDHLTGYTALVGILLALHARHTSGRGQRVEATLFDTALSLLVPHAANFFESGKEQGLLGSAHPNIAPYDRFKCGDGEIFLGILNNRQFERFCAVIARADLGADSRFSSNPSRLANRVALQAEIERSIGAMTRDHLCNALMKNGVPAGPVNSIAEAFAQPHAQHRQMEVSRKQYRGIGVPVRLADNPGQAGSAPRPFNADAVEVLLAAGYSREEVGELVAEGAVSGKNIDVKT